MATDGARFTDEVSVELNPPKALPDRPSDSKSKDDWIEYVVALGADRVYVTGDTEHFDMTLRAEGTTEPGTYETHPGLTKDELVDLADRLGG